MNFQPIKHEQVPKPIPGINFLFLLMSSFQQLEISFYERFTGYQNPLYYSMYGYGMPQNDELIRNVLNPLLMQNYMLNQYIATQNMFLKSSHFFNFFSTILLIR